MTTETADPPATPIIRLRRLGDFYEAYAAEAETLAREMEITLGRVRHSAIRPHIEGAVRVPMAGVPYHAIDRYAARLAERGYAVELEDSNGK